MITKKIALDNYDLHIIKLETFKNVTIDIRFKNVYEREMMPALNFLSNILTFTNKKYNKREDFVNEEMDLYDLYVDSSFYARGNNNFFNIRATMLNEKYTEKGMFNKVLEFIKAILYEPNIVNNKFDTDSFNVIKRDIKNDIDTTKESPSKYALIRFYEELDTDGSYLSILSKEYQTLLDEITEENLVDTYNYLLNNFSVDILVTGDLDIDEVTTAIKKNFKFSKGKESSNERKIYPKVNKPNVVINKAKSLQAKLVIGYTLENLTDYEYEFVLPIFNIILGAYTNSKFFKNIREKYSLCYSINSSNKERTNLILIRSGITKSNYDKVLACIKKEIKSMKKLDEGSLEDARMFYKMVVNEACESQSEIIYNYFNHIYYGSHLLEEKLSGIEKITIKEVENITDKLTINTIYLYGGDSK